MERFIDEVTDAHQSFARATPPAELERKGILRALTRLQGALYCAQSIVDTVWLTIWLALGLRAIRSRTLAFTQRSFCVEDETGGLQDRILKGIAPTNAVFINHSKDTPLSRIDGRRVFNVGGVVRVVAFVLDRTSAPRHLYLDAHRLVNDLFLRFTHRTEVLSPCFYDANGLSLVTSRYRSRFHLSEVQHGSIINFPPYRQPAPVPIANRFFVRNEHTAEYLRTHLCLHSSAEYQVIRRNGRSLQRKPGLHVLYASTIEVGGLHPVFLNFLNDPSFTAVQVCVRLHPRERAREPEFRRQLDASGRHYSIDESPDWLDAVTAENTIVVSPWSSILEEAADLGFAAITIDPVGRERYAHLIEGNSLLWSNSLTRTLNDLNGRSDSE